MLYIGLDVHYRTTTCCILGDDGRPVKTQTLKGPWRRTVDYLQSLKDDLAVCFEASVGYGPLYEALLGFCKRVEVAHPGDLRLIFRSKRKNDRPRKSSMHKKSPSCSTSMKCLRFTCLPPESL